MLIKIQIKESYMFLARSQGFIVVRWREAKQSTQDWGQVMYVIEHNLCAILSPLAHKALPYKNYSVYQNWTKSISK